MLRRPPCWGPIHPCRDVLGSLWHLACGQRPVLVISNGHRVRLSWGTTAVARRAQLAGAGHTASLVAGACAGTAPLPLVVRASAVVVVSVCFGTMLIPVRARFARTGRATRWSMGSCCNSLNRRRPRRSARFRVEQEEVKDPNRSRSDGLYRELARSNVNGLTDDVALSDARFGCRIPIIEIT